MSYSAYFIPTDQTIGHLGTLVASLDPLLQMQYTGFAAVSAVTVYELAIKEIFREFAGKKNKVFGHFVDKHFRRINGKIGLDVIQNDYLSRFGGKYQKRFNRLISLEENSFLRANRQSIKSSYGNLIAWRHEFAHEGRIPTNATFFEVQRSYDCGKKIIDVLALTLVR